MLLPIISMLQILVAIYNKSKEEDYLFALIAAVIIMLFAIHEQLRKNNRDR